MSQCLILYSTIIIFTRYNIYENIMVKHRKYRIKSEPLLRHYAVNTSLAMWRLQWRQPQLRCESRRPIFIATGAYSMTRFTWIIYLFRFIGEKCRIIISRRSLFLIPDDENEENESTAGSPGNFQTFDTGKTY